MTRTLIKICGITNVEDAIAAIDAGADCLGLIFVAASPRSISEAQAKTIVEVVRQRESSVKLVGVFQNASMEEVTRIVQNVSLDWVQLHGEESPAFCRQMPVPVIKALTVKSALSPDTLLAQLTEYAPSSASNIQLLLLDTPKVSETRNAWLAVQDVLSDAAVRTQLTETPHFLAGGLLPETVPEVIARFHPHGVDVASGVEIAPGKKDGQKLAAFCRAVRQVENAGVQTGVSN